MMANILKMMGTSPDAAAAAAMPVASKPVASKPVASKPSGSLLSEKDMEAMVLAGYTKRSHQKTLGKNVFSLLGIAPSDYVAAQDQWKSWVEGKATDDLSDSPIVSEEIMNELKATGDFKATNHGKKLRDALITRGIHPILAKKAGAEWRAWAESKGLGKRPTLPPRSVGGRIKVPAQPILTEAQMETLRSLKTPEGQPLLHQGSQGRKGLTDALVELGVERKDLKKAGAEWRAWAKGKGIVRPGSRTPSTGGSVGTPEASATSAAVEDTKESDSSPVRADYTLSSADKDYLEDNGFTTSSSREDLEKAFVTLGIEAKFYESAITGWKAHAEEEGLTLDLDL